MNLNVESTIQLIVTVITAVITLFYLWKTRVIGANKELLAKYKDDSEKYEKIYKEYKKKYEDKRNEFDELTTQYNMNLVRLTEAQAIARGYENQPYRANNASLEGVVHNEPNQTV